jgi:hypothetical protein
MIGYSTLGRRCRSVFAPDTICSSLALDLLKNRTFILKIGCLDILCGHQDKIKSN